MPRTAVSPPGTPRSHLPFSPAVRAGDLVFVSGQASVDETGQIVDDTFAGELARSMANAERILTAAGGSMDDVVSVRCYVGQWEDRDEFNRLYPQYFSEPYPARTTTFGGIGHLKFEIDVIAHIPATDGANR
ncbi:RidA family protein [Kribbella sp. NPDC050459]|uniref:RidA family protein n=1 Tax=Kribbella sp. NPDC050459 TaxID=3155785 RepID=UPI0033E47863